MVLHFLYFYQRKIKKYKIKDFYDGSYDGRFATMHLQSLFRETKCEFCVFDYFLGGNQKL